MAVLIGLPIVAVAALVTIIRRPAVAAEPAPADGTATTAGQTLPVAIGTGGIGAGDLAGFVSAFTAELETIRRTIEDQETGRPITPPRVPTATAVSVRAGETWRAVLRRHYGPDGTNLWQVVRTNPANASLFSRYPSIDAVLPTGAIVTMPARNW